MEWDNRTCLAKHACLIRQILFIFPSQQTLASEASALGTRSFRNSAHDAGPVQARERTVRPIARAASAHRHAAALDTACAGDADMRTQVLRLLAVDREANSRSFLNRRAIQDAARLIAEPSPDLPSPGMVIGDTAWARASAPEAWALYMKPRPCRFIGRVC